MTYSSISSAGFTQPAFAAGELSPLLSARADISSYSTGVAACKNFVVLRQGGLAKRPGTLFCARPAAEAVRLIPFIFSETDAYVLEVSADGIRIFYRGGVVIDKNGRQIKLKSPYTACQLRDIQFCQNADTVFLTHPSVPPKVLRRFSQADGEIGWEIIDYRFKQGPYEDININDQICVYAEGNNNGKTRLKAVDAKNNPIGLFKEAHLNAPFYLELSDFSKLKPWVAASTVKEGDLRYSDFKIYRCVALSGSETDTVTGPNKPTHDAGGEWDGDGDKRDGKYYGVKWQYVSAGKLHGHITRVISASEAELQTDDGIVPAEVSGIENASYKWAFGAFSGVNGYPSCVTFFQQRLVFASTKAAPQTVWMSGTSRFDFFGTSAPAVDSDALTFSLTSNRINKIVGFVPLKALIVLTEGAQFAVMPVQGGLSASTLKIEIQSHIGAAPVQPLSIDESALFVQAKRGAIRDMGYSFQTDNYTGRELSILSHHLFDGKQIVDWAYAQTPDSMVFIVFSDGTAAMMTYFKEQEVTGFSQFETAGHVLSVCSVPEGDYDAVYLTVRRQNGVFVERMANRQSTDVYLDSTLAHEGDSWSVVSNLEHLNAQTVTCLLEGRDVTAHHVVKGMIELPYEASRIIAGLPYRAVMSTLDVQTAESPDVLIRRKTLKRAFVRSLGDWDYSIRIKGKAVSPKPTALNRQENEGERVFEALLADRFGRSGRITLTHDNPKPMTILGVTLDMDAAG